MMVTMEPTKGRFLTHKAIMQEYYCAKMFDNVKEYVKKYPRVRGSPHLQTGLARISTLYEALGSSCSGDLI